jgi:hypothetical protein
VEGDGMTISAVNPDKLVYKRLHSQTYYYKWLVQ